MRATQLWYRKLLKDPDNDALKREYAFWMEKLDGLKYEIQQSIRDNRKTWEVIKENILGSDNRHTIKEISKYG
jgi:hypothetical protein